MYEAVRELANTNKKSSNIYVHNENGLNVCSDSIKAKLIKDYFHQQFTDSSDPDPLPAFEESPKPLDSPITQLEVSVAIAKLKNNKANGPDNIPNELLKALKHGLPSATLYMLI